MADFPTPTTWTTAWDCSSSKDYGTYAVSGALALTSVRTGDNYGGSAVATLIADGVHIPTFDGAASMHYNNVPGAQNLVSLVDVGSVLYWSVGVTIPGLSLVPLWQSVPSLSQGYVGTPIVITGTAEGATSYTYQWLSGGTAISGATSATYTPVSGDFAATITCLITAINTNGSVPITSGSTVVAQADVVTLREVQSSITAASSGGYNTYTPANGASWTTTLCDNANRKLQASPSADVTFTATAPSGSDAIMLNLSTAQEGHGFEQTNPAAYEVYNAGGNYSSIGSVSMAAAGGARTAAAGDTIRFRRTSANVVLFEVLPTGQSTWVSVYTDNTQTVDLYPSIQWGAGLGTDTSIVKCTGAVAS